MESILEVPIYGRIATMKLFRPKSSQQDFLLVTTEKFQMFILSFDSETQEILTRATSNLYDRIGRPTENGPITIIDPLCRAMVFLLYEGSIRVAMYDSSKQEITREMFNLRLEELNVIDMVFLDNTSIPTIAILYEDSKGSRHIKSYQIGLKERELLDGPFQQSNIDQSSSMLISVPKSMGGGVIILSEHSITYHDAISKFKSIQLPENIVPVNFKCYSILDENGSRYLLGDAQGNLYLLKINDLDIIQLGHTSIPSSICYLDNRFLFIGSHYGDSQLLKLTDQFNIGEEYLEVIATYTNLAPITDFCVVDQQQQQQQIVTCSGGYKDGSIRIIRNGIGIEQVTSIEMEGVQSVFNIENKYIVLSFIGATRVLGFTNTMETIQEEEEQEEEELQQQLQEVEHVPGLVTNAQTIDIGQVSSLSSSDHQFVQVTSQSIRIIDTHTWECIAEWKPQTTITLSSLYENHILIAQSDKTIHYLQMTNGNITLIKSIVLPHEISCLNICPPLQSCAIGLWGDHSIHILSLPSLGTLCKQVLSEEQVLPRSILLYPYDSYCLCALGDGQLLTWRYDSQQQQLVDKKKISLGTKPITLKLFHNNENIFACGDRPTVIYVNTEAQYKKLNFSNVNLKQVISMCSFGNSLVFVTEDHQLMIGTMDQIQKLHVRSVALHQQLRRIAYCTATNRYVVATMNNVQLLDGSTYEVLYEVSLEQNEQVSSLLYHAQWGMFVVGTAYVLPEEEEPSKGRLLVYTAATATEDKLILIADATIKGCPYALESFQDKLLATANSKVELWKLVQEQEGGAAVEEGDASTSSLQLVYSHPSHVLALTLQSRGDFVLVGDLMRSISILKYKTIEESFEEIARDANPLWVTATQIIDDDTFVLADNFYNVVVLKKNNEASSDEEQRRLIHCAKYHVGDFINRFHHGSLISNTNTTTTATANATSDSLIYCTVSGAIGVIKVISAEQYKFFGAVQKAINMVVKGVGNLDHREWRDYYSERRQEPHEAFIDGDLVESFLELKPSAKQKIVSVLKQEMAISLEDLTKQIEDFAMQLH